MHIPSRLLTCLALCLSLAACGGGGSDAASPTPAPSPSSPTSPPPTPASADVAILMMGNSHTVVADLPARLQTALQAALPGRSVRVEVAPRSGFLEEHLHEPTTLALLNSRRWQAVVLQAQKYSSSGLFSYSTAEAEELVRRSKAQGAVPVLFPEWARWGFDEVDRIWALHAGIAAVTPACAAPIPQAWARALAAEPGLPLHDRDGNHAAPAGAELTALVLMASITGLSPATLPDLPGGGDAALQRSLRNAATAAVTAQNPRAFCPGEALIR